MQSSSTQDKAEARNTRSTVSDRQDTPVPTSEYYKLDQSLVPSQNMRSKNGCPSPQPRAIDPMQANLPLEAFESVIFFRPLHTAKASTVQI